MRPRRARTPMVLLACGLMFSVSCAPAASRTTPRIRVGRPLISGHRMVVPEAEATGLTQLDRWPKACDLLTAADMKALLPQITKVIESSRSQQIEIVNTGAGDGAYDVPDSACQISFWIAGAERRTRSRPDVVRVEDIAVGSPDVVEDNFEALARSKPMTPSDLGALRCVLDTDVYYCLMPRVAFSVGTGHSLNIHGFVGQPAGMRTRAYWVSRVMPGLIRSVTSKLPRR